VYAVEGEFGRADEGAEVQSRDASFPACPGERVGKFGVGCAYPVHVDGAVAPGFVDFGRYLHGYARSRVHPGGKGAFAYGEDIRERNFRPHAHEEIVESSHDEKPLGNGQFSFEHFSGGRAVHTEVLKFVPGEAGRERTPAFFSGNAVAEGETVAKAEDLHGVALFLGKLRFRRIQRAGSDTEERREDKACLLEVHPFLRGAGLFRRSCADDERSFLLPMWAGVFFSHAVLQRSLLL